MISKPFIHRILIVLTLVLTLSHAVLAAPTLYKSKSLITVEWKRYDISSTEEIILYGAKHRKFLDENWYWGEAGYGAMVGERSGYLEGGLMGGYFGKLADNWVYDARLFLGAGGGGSAPQGGGFIVHWSIGMGYELDSGISFLGEYGHITFINGDIESPTLALSMNIPFWNLSMKQTKEKKQ